MCVQDIFSHLLRVLAEASLFFRLFDVPLDAPVGKQTCMNFIEDTDYAIKSKWLNTKNINL